MKPIARHLLTRLGLLAALAAHLPAAALPSAAAAPPPARPNFLFIAIDDLNDFTGYAAEEPGNFLQVIYPDPAVRARIRQRLTPNLDRLAARGAPFGRNYCASALCGPSRTALLTGVPPHLSGYYLHATHFRTYDTLADAITLPQQLKAHGYFTTGLGKIFHKPNGTVDGPLGDDWADARNSWSQWVNHAMGCNGGTKGPYSPPDGGLMQFGPSRLTLEQSEDYGIADFAANLLEHRTATTTDGKSGSSQTVTLPAGQPFFLAAGLFRPHLPFHAPQAFFDRFPTAEMTGLDRAALDAIIADLQDLPPGADRFTDFNHGKLKTVMENARRIGGPDAEVPAWRDLVQAYLACVSFADACAGRILDGLAKSPDRDNTVVFLWSDHGFHLGSKYHVAKQALWEEANRTTLIVHDPRSAAVDAGVLRHQITSLTDLFPTICALAGVPLPPTFVLGADLASLLAHADAPALHEDVLMTYMEGNHSLRTDRFRYVRYHDGTEELYDIVADPRQLTNLAANPTYATQRERLAAELNRRVVGEVPDTHSGRNTRTDD